MNGGVIINPLSESTYLILLALHQGPLHGYGVIKAIEKASEGNYIIAPGTLYGVVKNIQKQGLIETIEVQTEQRKKKTYRITDRGKEVLRSEYSRYLKMIELTKKIVTEREE